MPTLPLAVARLSQTRAYPSQFLFPSLRKEKGLAFAPLLMFSLSMPTWNLPSTDVLGPLQEACSAPVQTWGMHVIPVGARQAQGPDAAGVNSRKQSTHTGHHIPARVGIVMGRDTALGLLHHVVTIAKLKRRERRPKSALALSPTRVEPAAGPGPSEGVWELVSSVRSFHGWGTDSTATALQSTSRTRPRARVNVSRGFVVLSRSWEWREPQPHK